MISAFSMITSSAGTSWWPDFMVVATPLILSTTSVPLEQRLRYLLVKTSLQVVVSTS